MWSLIDYELASSSIDGSKIECACIETATREERSFGARCGIQQLELLRNR